MLRGSPPGKVWRDATGEFAVNVPAETNGRYGPALDLLVQKVGPHLWDCNGGIWELRGADEVRHRLSLAWLGHLVVNTCEEARERAEEARKAPRTFPPPMSGRRLTAAKRRKIAKAARSVASLLKAGGEEIWRAMIVARKHVIPSPESAEPVPPGLSSPEQRAWFRSERRLTPSKLAAAVLAVADEMDGHDNRAKPRGRREDPETTLAAELVTWLRVATGAPWGYQRGDRIPTGGRPFYDVTAAFLQAAGWPRMTAPMIKSRLESRNGA